MSRVNESTGREREKAQKMLDFLEAELAAIPDDPAKMISDGTLREMIISTNKPDIGRYMGVSAVEKPFAASDESYGRSFRCETTRSAWLTMMKAWTGARR